MTPPARVPVVDDDALVRAGLTMMPDGAEVPAATAAHAPDVVLMDLRMPGDAAAKRP
jgi:DNA-binding NarL/FixJ family response regulator